MGFPLPKVSYIQSGNTHKIQAVFQSGLQSQVFTGYLDARVFMLYDDCPCLVYGPLSENIHGFDERVSLSSIKNITRTLALFIADWCGLEAV